MIIGGNLNYYKMEDEIMGIEIVSSSCIRITERNPYAVLASLPALLHEVQRLGWGWLKEFISISEYEDIAAMALMNIEKGFENIQIYEELLTPSLPFEGEFFLLRLRFAEGKIFLTAHPGQTPGVEPIRTTAVWLERESMRYQQL